MYISSVLLYVQEWEELVGVARLKWGEQSGSPANTLRHEMLHVLRKTVGEFHALILHGDNNIC